MTTLKTVLITLLIAMNLSAITLNKIQKNVVISGDNGGLAKDGSPWNSNSIKGKVYVMFYIDPDERNVNEHFSDALHKKNYDKSKYGSIAIVNLAATWKPNFIIEKLLKSKQKEYPDTIYVKDKASVLVKAWGIADNASDILVFDTDGKLLFYKAGALNQEDMDKVFKLIEQGL